MRIVAEIGLQHCGCLGTALAYIQAIAAAGADCAKFQDHRYDPCNKFRPNTFFPQDETRHAYWERTSFNQEQWRMIAQKCRALNLEYIVSPFSMKAFELQNEIGPDRWKIASSKVTDLELIDACVGTGKPIVVSSGMSNMNELEAAWDRIPQSRLWALECQSVYPCPPELIHLGSIGWPTPYMGISDHSGHVWPSIYAASVGYQMAEVHVVFSRDCFGPDVTSSITIAELKQLVEGVRFIEKMGTADKDSLAAAVKEVREVFVA